MGQPTESFTLGYFTAALPDKPLEEQIVWAAEHGFEALELAAWPVRGGKNYRGGHLAVRGLSPGRVEALRGLLEQHRLRISSLGYYDNCLHPNAASRKGVVNHLKRVIEAARSLNVGLVGTFVGRDPNRSEEENLSLIPGVFDALVDFASERGVRLMIENCPMVGWQREGLVGNLAYRPGVWEVLFERYGQLGLNFDPSHLHWQGMDHLELFLKFAERIYQVHAKDTCVDRARLRREGHLSAGWWEYRLPGLGAIDWPEFFRALVEQGYKGTVSIEHEDPEWSGSEERIMDGLAFSCREMKKWREAAGSECVATHEE